MKTLSILTVLSLLALPLAGCSSNKMSRSDRAVVGGAIGAGAGAAVSGSVGGALVGAGVGAAAGALSH